MMPLIEMANHASHGTPAHNLEVLFDDSGAMLGRTSKPVAAGEELCLCYHEDDTAAHMFSKYGIPPAALREGTAVATVLSPKAKAFVPAG